MIIPVKCFTCGKVLADKYQFYKREIKKRKISKSVDLENVLYLTKDFVDKTVEGEVMDILKLNKYCCRRHILTHVDIE